MLERMMELFERLVIAHETIAKGLLEECPALSVVEHGIKEKVAEESPSDGGEAFPPIENVVEEANGGPSTAEKEAEESQDALDPLTGIDFDDLANKKIVSLCEERGIPTTSPKTGRLRGYAPMKTALKKWREEFSQPGIQEGMIHVGPQTVVVDEVPQSDSPFHETLDADLVPEADPVQDLETPEGADVFGDPEIITPVAEIISAEKLLEKGIEAYHIAEANLKGSGNGLIAKYTQQYSGQPSLKNVPEEHRNAVYNALCAIRRGNA